MAVQTGRTVSKFITFRIDDSAGAMRSIAVDSVGVVGLVYDEVDLTAWMDAVKGALPNHPDAPISIAGPWDTTAATGSHVVLSGIASPTYCMTPRSLDIQFGMRQTYVTGEPQFGISGVAAGNVGYVITSYTVDPSAGKYSATFRLFPGSTAPAWGLAAET